MSGKPTYALAVCEVTQTILSSKAAVRRPQSSPALSPVCVAFEAVPANVDGGNSGIQSGSVVYVWAEIGHRELTTALQARPAIFKLRRFVCPSYSVFESWRGILAPRVWWPFGTSH